MNQQKMTIIDVFCGIGGLTHGFVMEGIRVSAGIDIDSSCRYAYEVNNAGARFIASDLEKMTNDDWFNLYPENQIRVMIGCAPCQPFSSNNTRKSKNTKWHLVDKFADIIENVLPDVVSMENVPQLKSFDEGKVFSRFQERLIRAGYHVSFSVVDALEYGVPQHRKRLVLLASRLGVIKLEAPSLDLFNKATPLELTVGFVLDGLPKIKAGEIDENDTIHRSSAVTPINLKRLKASSPGGSWREWDKSLRSPCHLRESGRKSPSAYSRLNPLEPSPTITTQFHGFGNGRFGHPEQHRALSLREGAILQGFPQDYNFVPLGGKVHISTIARHIGNAVPVPLARSIARTIHNHVNFYQKEGSNV
jgi:DNA (cytosine-5)-methyltransferase 1